MSFVQDPKISLGVFIDFKFDRVELTTETSTQWVYTYYTGQGAEIEAVAEVTINFTDSSKSTVLDAQKVFL